MISLNSVFSFVLLDCCLFVQSTNFSIVSNGWAATVLLDLHSICFRNGLVFVFTDVLADALKLLPVLEYTLNCSISLSLLSSTSWKISVELLVFFALL